MSTPVQSPTSGAGGQERGILVHWVVRLLTLIAVFAAVTATWFLLAARFFGHVHYLTSVFGATVAACSAIALVTRLVERRSLASIGLGWRGLLPQWVCGFALGATLITGCMGTLALLGSYHIIDVRFALAPLATALLVQVLVGLWEELVFRGILFRLLEEGIGSWLALLLSAALFGAGHLANANATLWGATAIAIEAGLFLGAAYMLTRSLWFVAGVHTAWNVAQGPLFGSVISGSGGGHFSVFQAAFRGPEILTGGAFGVEASLIAVLLGLGVALWFGAAAHHRQRTLRPLLWRGGVNQLPAPADATTRS